MASARLVAPGRGSADVAGLLGLLVSAVDALLFRARGAVREWLEGSRLTATGHLPGAAEAVALIRLRLPR
jgi:hypothetical protein